MISWHGLETCWWSLTPTGPKAIPSDGAARRLAEGRPVYLGTYADAAAIPAEAEVETVDVEEMVAWAGA